jgi:hypothetical protein
VRNSIDSEAACAAAGVTQMFGSGPAIAQIATPAISSARIALGLARMAVSFCREFFCREFFCREFFCREFF